MTRFNITLPDEIAEKLNEKENKSRFIAEALRDRFSAEESARLEGELIEGYKTGALKDREIVHEWGNTELDNWD